MNVSLDFIEAIHELVRDEIIGIETVPPMTYVIDGCTLSFPLVENDIGDETLRWAPLVFNKGLNYYNIDEGQAA